MMGEGEGLPTPIMHRLQYDEASADSLLAPGQSFSSQMWLRSCSARIDAVVCRFHFVLEYKKKEVISSVKEVISSVSSAQTTKICSQTVVRRLLHPEEIRGVFLALAPSVTAHSANNSAKDP
jgi:hypothetical protein